MVTKENFQLMCVVLRNTVCNNIHRELCSCTWPTCSCPLPNARNKLLPSHLSKMFVYRKYKETATERATEPVGKSKFLELWDELTPHIAVMKPSSDLSFKCQQNNQLIMKAVYKPEAVRKQ